jgi:kexin
MRLSLSFSQWTDSLRAALTFGFIAGLLPACGGGGDGGNDSRLRRAAPTVPIMTQGPDPLLERQWHLFNTGQSGGLPGMDLGLEGVDHTGRGVLIAFIDGAVQISHPDLVSNLYTIDGFLPSPDPSPPSAPRDAPFNDRAGEWDDAHGTAVVGIAVASAENSLGGRGVAPQARFVAFDGLSSGQIAQSLRSALSLGADIVNNSWGTLDPAVGQAASYRPPDPAWRQVLEEALARGRQGKGAVVVFAAGNGGRQDDSNRDGYANHPGVLAIGAVDAWGRPPSYAEPGTNILVSAPSGPLLTAGDTTAGIWTTDIAGPRGLSGGITPSAADYSAFPAGTSASAPMVTGVVALMLQANPALSWRDVRWLLAKTARPANMGVSQPEVSAMNAHGFHPLVGFGRVHAGDAVTSAAAARPLPSEQRCDSGPISVGQLIQDAPSEGVSTEYRFSDCPIRVVESVQLNVVVEHTYGADLKIELTSPADRRSLLGRPHVCATDIQGPCGDLSLGWTFHSLRHMGEAALGLWRLDIQDMQSGDSGRFLGWQLILVGH